MAKRRRRQRTDIPADKPRLDKKTLYGNLLRLLCLVAATIVVFGVYRFLLDRYYFEYVLIGYMSVATILIFTYVIYNRGFSRRGLTVEMLPDTMSEEEKLEFIEDGRHRLRKSRPLLIAVAAFAFTFIFDAIELFAIPFLKELFSI